MCSKALYLTELKLTASVFWPPRLGKQNRKIWKPNRSWKERKKLRNRGHMQQLCKTSCFKTNKSVEFVGFFVSAVERRN